jgi:hypothetical protein
VSLYDGKLTIAGVTGFEFSTGGDQQPWRVEQPNMAWHNLSLLRVGGGHKWFRATVAVSGGWECGKVGAVKLGHEQVCLQEVKLTASFPRGKNYKFSLNVGPGLTKFGITGIGTSRVLNPTSWLSPAGQHSPYSDFGGDVQVDLENWLSGWVGTTTWNGVLPIGDDTAQAGYVTATFRPFALRHADTDSNITLTGMFMPKSPLYDGLYFGDLTLALYRPWGTVLAEVNGGSASGGNEKWICAAGTFGWRIIDRYAVKPLLVTTGEGCSESVSGPVKKLAGVGALPDGGWVAATGGGVKLEASPSGTDPVRFNFYFMFRREWVSNTTPNNLFHVKLEAYF